MLKKMLALLATVCAAPGWPATAAHAFPGQPVRITMPQPPGGAFDALTSARSAKAFAQIPRATEAGLADFDVNPWFGWMAPGRVPREVAMKIHTDGNDLLRTREVTASFEAQGAEPSPTSPDAVGQQLRADAVRWGQVVRTSGARLD